MNYRYPIWKEGDRVNTKEKDLSRYYLNELEERLFNKSLENERHNHLWQYVVDERNIICAIKIIKGNGGSNTPGPDNKTIRMVLLEDINTVIKEIKGRLFGYVKGKARKVEIPKENGKMRPLGITNIYDRIAQQCIRNILEPIVESHFNQESFGFRRNRNAQECISYIATSIQFNEDGHIYDCDLKSYFDMVEIDLVIDKLKKNHNIHDLQFLKAIKSLMWIDLVNPKVKYNGVGLRQGTILGPILANVMFHDFELKLNEINDHKRKNERELISNPNIFKNFGRNYKRGRKFYFNWLQERRVVKIIRYADDFVLISKGKYDIYDAIMLFEDWCVENKLEINKDKTKLIRLTQDVELDFVGYKLSKSSKKRHTFVIAPKDQKKIWNETKKRLKWSIYKKNYDYILVYLRGIFQYYDVCTNMTWLISRVYLYLLALARRRRRYGHRIIMKRGENVYFLLDNVVFDLWDIRKHSVKSTKSYMLEVNKLWSPNRDTVGSKEWLSQYISNKTHCGRNSMNIIYVPSLINQYRKEPITGQEYYSIYPNDIVIHHKIPLSMGGNNEYTNLILLRAESHKLVHKENLIKEEIPGYINIKVLNKYRIMCGLDKV